jgi:hypothetical protein
VCRQYYQIGFDIRPEQMSELEIGASLERALGYLRILLPGETGHITSRAMYSLDRADSMNGHTGSSPTTLIAGPSLFGRRWKTPV